MLVPRLKYRVADADAARMSDHASLDAARAQPADEAGAKAAGRSFPTAGQLKAFVLTTLFLVMVASVLVNDSDLVFGIAVAVMWTAFIALVWELAARALARARG